MLDRLNTVIKNTEPKVIPLVHLIETFEAQVASADDPSLEVAKQRAVDILKAQLERFEAATAQVTERCVEIIAAGDLIVVHSPTACIRNALIRAHTELERSFRVLVLKQDFIRTKELVNDLERHGLEHLVISEYKLSHYLKSAAKLFIRAVSLTRDNRAVTGIGTADVFSLCHWYHVPVYLFVESIKFAHQTLADQHIFDETRDQTEADFTFHLKTHSHDFIDLTMVDHLITENGEIRQRT
jgi:translation initiation factor eIF-2B subunit alpha